MVVLLCPVVPPQLPSSRVTLTAARSWTFACTLSCPLDSCCLGEVFQQSSGAFGCDLSCWTARQILVGFALGPALSYFPYMNPSWRRPGDGFGAHLRWGWMWLSSNEYSRLTSFLPQTYLMAVSVSRIELSRTPSSHELQRIFVKQRTAAATRNL